MINPVTEVVNILWGSEYTQKIGLNPSVISALLLKEGLDNVASAIRDLKSVNGWIDCNLFTSSDTLPVKLATENEDIKVDIE